VSVVADVRRKRHENEKENRRRDKRAVAIIFRDKSCALDIPVRFVTAFPKIGDLVVSIMT
jgi:hypothetical protein